VETVRAQPERDPFKALEDAVSGEKHAVSGEKQ
jgi:hypothetical protein